MLRQAIQSPRRHFPAISPGSWARTTPWLTGLADRVLNQAALPDHTSTPPEPMPLLELLRSTESAGWLSLAVGGSALQRGDY